MAIAGQFRGRHGDVGGYAVLAGLLLDRVLFQWAIRVDADRKALKARHLAVCMGCAAALCGERGWRWWRGLTAREECEGVCIVPGRGICSRVSVLVLRECVVGVAGVPCS